MLSAHGDRSSNMAWRLHPTVSVSDCGGVAKELGVKSVYHIVSRARENDKSRLHAIAEATPARNCASEYFKEKHEA